MTSPCLYLDIRETGISGWITPSETPDRHIRIKYDDLVEPEDRPRLNAALEILSGEKGFSACKKAVVTIPPDWVWFRYPILPFNDKKRLKQVLPLELKPWFPDPDLPVLIDFHILDFPLETLSHLIFTGALAEKKMETIFTALSSMGISPALVTPRGLAQAQVYSSGSEYTNFLFIHMAEEEITLTLTIAGTPIMVRILKNRPSEFEQQLAREIQTTLTSAGLRTGLARKTFYDLPILLSDPKATVEPDPTQFAENLNAALKNLIPDLKNPVIKITPAPWQQNITPNRRPPHLLNFSIGPYKPGSFLTRYKPHLIACLVLLALVFSLEILDISRKNSRLEIQINQVQTTSMGVYKKTFPGTGPIPIHAPVLLMESKVKQARQVKNGEKATALPAGAHIRIMEILHELSGRIPADIDMEISRLALNHGRLVLTGITGNFKDVDRIKGLVQTSPRFTNVKIKSAEADKTGKQVRFKFILEI